MFSVVMLSGDAVLASLHDGESRQHRLKGRVSAHVTYGSKDLLVATRAGFLTDMRSGPSVIDVFVPHLGSQAERRAWWLHDVLSYDIGFSFEEVNQILKLYLLSECGYSKFVANLVKFSVSCTKSWFGKPPKGSIYYPNLSLIEYV